jgi:hypothetical protein
MGLTYRIHPEVQLLVIRGDGTISQQERPETLRAWMRDPDYPTCTAALCDFTNARSAPRLSELHELIQVMREDRSGRGPSKLAIVTRWCKDFDNWAVCDAMSFNLFDRTPVARRLAESNDATARWVGRDALRELTSPALTTRLKA